MFNTPTNETLNQIPKLYQTEHTPLADKLIQLHFFIGGCDWYIAETDGTDICWGFAILNSDLTNSEWGYISLEELKSVKVGWMEVDNDLFWEVRPASEVPKIRSAHRWVEQGGECYV